MRSSGSKPEVDHDACGVCFIAQLGSSGSRDVVERALTALERLCHRGGVDADGLSGDGAGILTPIPKDFIRKRARESEIELPESFGMGMAFLSPGQEAAARASVESSATELGLRCLGWREVPTYPSLLGPCALATLPLIRQCFFVTEESSADLERQLFLMRKRVQSDVGSGIYFCSLSSQSLVYKGLLTPLQLAAFYADLACQDFIAPFAIFHQRYSTNTSPSWQLAQPFRFVAHNGEINTIRANRRWTRAREGALRLEFGAQDQFRVLEEGVSDSASFDNALEVRLRQGSSVAAAMLRMVPPAWEGDPQTGPKLRRFLQKATREQEPWDGPAALVFSDGRMVGAKLDRNGLRPMRYTLTSDGLLVVGSEVGIADLRGKRIAERNRLGPAKFFWWIRSRARSSAATTKYPNCWGQSPAALAAASAIHRFVSRDWKAPRRNHTDPKSRHNDSPPRWVGPKISSVCSFSRSAGKGRKPSGAWATTRRLRFFLPSNVRCGI